MNGQDIHDDLRKTLIQGQIERYKAERRHSFGLRKYPDIEREVIVAETEELLGEGVSINDQLDETLIQGQVERHQGGRKHSFGLKHFPDMKIEVLKREHQNLHIRDQVLETLYSYRASFKTAAKMIERRYHESQSQKKALAIQNAGGMTRMKAAEILVGTGVDIENLGIQEGYTGPAPNLN